MLRCHPPGLASAETHHACLVLGRPRPEAAALPLVSDGLGFVLLQVRVTVLETRLSRGSCLCI